MKNLANYFSFEINAPRGLEGIESLLSNCELDLEARSSSDCDKTMLFAKEGSDFKWQMNIHTDNKLYGEGELYVGENFTIRALESFSAILRIMELPHIIRIDDEGSYLVKVLRYQWPEERYI